MRISNVGNFKNYEINFFEFIAPDGHTITSFFQVIAKPDLSLGCFELYQDALRFIDHCVLASCVEKPERFFTGLATPEWYDSLTHTDYFGG